MVFVNHFDIFRLFTIGIVLRPNDKDVVEYFAVNEYV